MKDADLHDIRAKWESLATQTYAAHRMQSGPFKSVLAIGRTDVQSLRPFLFSLSDQTDLLKDIIDDQDLYRTTVEGLQRSFRPSQAAVELFWQTYRPSEPLSPEHEPLMLDCLNYIFGSCRVPYEPDADESQWIEDLQVYVHIAAARAFRIMRNEDGLSEAAAECFVEAERAIERIRSAKGATRDYDIGLLAVTLVELSTNAVAALVLAESCRLQRAVGEYGAALHNLARADLLFYLANSNTQMPSQMAERLQQLIMPRSEAFSLLEAIESNRLVIQDWQQVTRDYTELLEGWKIGEDAEVSEWIARLMSARSWASAQLSPSEHRKMRDADEKDAAERRLKNYFFGESWLTLPSRAQASLKSADQTWNSKEGGRRESILNELLRATEEMCYEYIWQPLADSKESSIEFLKFEAIATDRHSAPSARDYVRLCKQGFFQDHLCRQKLAAKDVQLLRVELPNLLGQLADRRNPAEHETGSSTPRGVVDDGYKTFLGIGKRGVLPELARIGLELRGKRRRMG